MGESQCSNWRRGLPCRSCVDMLKWSSNRLIGSLSDVRRVFIDAILFAVSVYMSTENTSVSLDIRSSRF